MKVCLVQLKLILNSKNGPFYVTNETTLIQVRSGLFKHFYYGEEFKAQNDLQE